MALLPPARAPGEDLVPKAGAVSLFLLMKPGIVAAVALAGFTGMVMACRGLPPAETTAITLTSLICAAAGSAMINCCLEIAGDSRMKRLEKRVAALERIGVGKAILAGLLLIGAALVLAGCFLSWPSTLLILAAVLIYTLLYTLCLKRRSPWAAVPGGVPGALPVLIGAAAAASTMPPGAVVLFIVMLLWQPPHFWSLALVCRDEYLAAGIPSLPATLGDRATGWLILLYTAALIPATLALCLIGSLSPCSQRPPPCPASPISSSALSAFSGNDTTTRHSRPLSST